MSLRSRCFLISYFSGFVNVVMFMLYIVVCHNNAATQFTLLAPLKLKFSISYITSYIMSYLNYGDYILNILRKSSVS